MCGEQSWWREAHVRRGRTHEITRNHLPGDAQTSELCHFSIICLLRSWGFFRRIPTRGVANVRSASSINAEENSLPLPQGVFVVRKTTIKRAAVDGTLTLCCQAMSPSFTQHWTT